MCRYRAAVHHEEVPLEARIVLLVTCCGLAWFVRRTSARWLGAMSAAQPKKRRALAVEGRMVDAICVAVVLLGLVRLVGAEVPLPSA
jgi:hypothetical protein